MGSLELPEHRVLGVGQVWGTRVHVDPGHTSDAEASPPLPECTLAWGAGPGSRKHIPPTGGCLASAPNTAEPPTPKHSLSSPGSPASSPWQLRPLGASRYPDEGQLHWKLPGTLMQR